MKDLKSTIVLLMSVALLALASGCSGVQEAQAPQPGAPGTATAEPGAVTAEPSMAAVEPSPTEQAAAPEPTVAVTGVIKSVAASARVIELTETVEGFGSVALKDKTEIISKDNSAKALTDLKPGMKIEAVGQAGGSGAVLADQIRVLTVPVPPTGSGTGQWQPVQLPDVNLSFEAPAGWKRLGQEWAWVSPQSDKQRVGVNWIKREAGVEPTSLLPNHSVSLDAAPLDLSWGTAMKHTVEVSDPAAAGGKTVAVETHVIVQTDNYVYDFYATAPNPEELDGLWLTLDHMLNSVKQG